MTLYDIIILGGGPAGLTSGLYTSRAKLKTLLLESYILPSQIIGTDHIENYPGFPQGIDGFALIAKFKQQAEMFGLECRVGDVNKIQGIDLPCLNLGSSLSCSIPVWQVETDDGLFYSRSLIIASGAKPKELNVPGEAKFRGRGVSYCATCDGALFKDRDIVVVGGGDAAVEEALFLTRFASKVTLIHRRDSLRAAKILQERLLNHQRVDIVWNSVVIDISGQEGVETIKLKNVKTTQESILQAQGIFIFIGFIPNTKLVKGLVELDEQGYIITDDQMKTSKPGIFAAGDCRKKLLRQVITACGDGATAAFSAQSYLEEQEG